MSVPAFGLQSAQTQVSCPERAFGIVTDPWHFLLYPGALTCGLVPRLFATNTGLYSRRCRPHVSAVAPDKIFFSKNDKILSIKKKKTNLSTRMLYF